MLMLSVNHLISADVWDVGATEILVTFSGSVPAFAMVNATPLPTDTLDTSTCCIEDGNKAGSAPRSCTLTGHEALYATILASLPTATEALTVTEPLTGTAGKPPPSETHKTEALMRSWMPASGRIPATRSHSPPADTAADHAFTAEIACTGSVNVGKAFAASTSTTKVVLLPKTTGMLGVVEGEAVADTDADVVAVGVNDCDDVGEGEKDTDCVPDVERDVDLESE